jgi:hypothetical protein
MTPPMGGLREAETLFGVAEALSKRIAKKVLEDLGSQAPSAWLELSIRKDMLETIGCPL